MKKVFYILVLLIIGINTNIYSQTDYMKNRFSIGTYNFVLRPGFRNSVNLQNYRDLQYNTNLSFTYRGNGDALWNSIDGYNVMPSDYMPAFTNTLNDLYINQANYYKQKVFFERAKIIRGAMGQRSTYEAENNGTYNTRTPGYGYQNSGTGIDYTNDMGANVNGRMCAVGTHSAGYIVKELYENMEQINFLFHDGSGKTDMQFFQSDTKDSIYFWVVKPRMRIRVEDFNDPNKRELPVVSIDIRRYDSTKISDDQTFTIKVKDFAGLIGNYYGDYMENFYNINPITHEYLPKLKILADSLTAGVDKDHLGISKVDYRVYWYGNVDVWLDYVRLDDEWAHYLFTDPTDQAPGNREFFHTKIAQEIAALNPAANEGNGFGYFYLDEYPYNCYPCIAEVNRIIKNLCPNTNTGLVAMDAEYSIQGLNEMRNRPYNGILYDTLYSSGAVTDILINESYPFENHNVDNLGDRKHFIAFPADLNLRTDLILSDHVQGMYRKAPNDERYNYEVNKNLEQDYPFYFLGIYRKGADLIKKARLDGKDILFSISIQNHLFEQNLGDGWSDEYGLRDVTNEEVSLQSYLGLIYGAKQIMDFSYQSDNPKRKKDGYYYYNYGIAIDTIGTKREYNYYGQPKWQYLCSLNTKLRQIGEYLYPAGRRSDHLNLDDSRTINTIFQTFHPEYIYGLPYKYISDILSIYPNITGDFLDANTDEATKRYWEAGFFNPPVSNTSDKYSKYLIMLNKRCTPPLANVSAGDVRTLKMRFNPDELPNFNNWVVIDPLTNTTIATINKNSGEYYSLGVFQPGEGRLFKLAPVMQEGGTFVCDEDFGGLIVNCKANVYTGGHNLTVRNNTTIEFNEDCGITVENCSDVSFDGSGTKSIHLKGKNRSKWYGITANNISNSVLFNNTDFRNLKNGWAITVRNAQWAIIQQSDFYLEDAGSGYNLGAITVNNNAISSGQVYIQNNNIQVKDVTAAIIVFNSAGTSGYGGVSYNNISTSGNGRIGIFLSNRILDELWYNNISGFSEGIHTYCSNVRLKNNTVLSNKNGSKGIYGSVWSTLDLGYDNQYFYGGNTFTNNGNDCINLQVDKSYFISIQGYNNYNVLSNTNSYNLYGNGLLNGYSTSPTYSCFNGPNGNAIYDLKDTLGNPYSLQELPHLCNTNANEETDFVVSLPFNISDTVNKLSGINNQNPSYLQTLSKNFSTNIIKRNYDSAIIQGTELLLNYSDSIYAPEIITELYLACTSFDSVGLKVQSLKTFYEQLIINHSQNISIVGPANYYLQKCKVFLKQYESALVGFEDIIQQNPYSFDGLLASWDYAATVLLIDTTIGSGGMSSKDELNELFSSSHELDYLIDSLRIKRIQKYDTYDKSVFSSSDRRELIKKTGNVLIDERNKQINKVNDLQKEVSKSNGKKDTKAKQELLEFRTLNEVVKVKKPRNVVEYTKIISDDMDKIFKRNLSGENKEANSIPTTFNLYQNYPNPFNPVTKIAYDIPRDAKVKLVIYDILGREVKMLVNNEFKTAGKYITEFNGSYLASGVYFARILVNDGKEFVAVKKMVLVK